MGYFTHFHGEGTYKLDPFYEKCLQGYIVKRFSNLNTIKIENGTILFEGEFQDFSHVGPSITQMIFNCIVKYGEFLSLDVYSSGEAPYDMKSYVFRNGEIHIDHLGFKDEKRKQIETDDVIELFDFSCFERYEILSDHDDEGIYCLLGDLLENAESDKFVEVYEELKMKIQNGLEFQFVFIEDKVEFSKDGIFQTPLEIVESELFSKTIEKFSDYPFSLPSKDEKREIQLKDGKWYPLAAGVMEIFHPYKHDEPSIPDLKNVRLEDESFVSPCEVCVHRLRKITGGCDTCVPNVK